MKEINAKISDIIPDDRNANKHSEFGMARLEKGIRENGLGRSILISSDNKIIAGNGVTELAGSIGLNDVQIVNSDGRKIVAVRRTDIKSGTKEFYNMALSDNIIAKENIVMDAEVVDAICEEYEIKEWKLEEVIKEQEGENDYRDQLESIFVQGDFIEFNNHRLLVGSSCNVDDVDKLMTGEKADLIFTDPPFDLEDTYSNLIIDTAKEDCHVFIMNSDKLLIENIKNNQEYFRKMFYVDFRQARLVSNKQPMTRVDPIAEFLKGKGKFNNMKDGFSTLIECAKIHNNNADQNFGFNQAKKVELPETFILHYSKPNELVCDFFGGAGSTLIASEKNNRKCFLMEFDGLNATIIINRWVDYMKEHKKLFEIKVNGLDKKDLFIPIL